jgi:hypothetical protein
MDAVPGFESVNMGDVGVIERRQHLRFTVEPRQSLRIAGEHVGQNFYRDFTLQLDVARAIHLTHAARTQRRDDLVRPEASVGGQRHGYRTVVLILVGGLSAGQVRGVTPT